MKTSRNDQNLTDLVGQALQCTPPKLEVTQWAVVGRERNWVRPCWLEVRWTLDPSRQKPMSCCSLSLLIISGLFGLVKIFSAILKWHPVVPHRIPVRRAKFSALCIDQSGMSNLLVDIWSLITCDSPLFPSALIGVPFEGSNCYRSCCTKKHWSCFLSSVLHPFITDQMLGSGFE